MVAVGRCTRQLGAADDRMEPHMLAAARRTNAVVEPVTRPAVDGVAVVTEIPGVASVFARHAAGRTVYEVTAWTSAGAAEVGNVLRRIPTGSKLEAVAAIEIDGEDVLRLFYA
jgi:hypothetical protein